MPTTNSTDHVQSTAPEHHEGQLTLSGEGNQPEED